MLNVFLTGMVRSGTTLLEKLLSNHPRISMLSQPFPQIFIGMKTKFHKKINHPEMYYVLNHYQNEQLYDIYDVTSFLNNELVDLKNINKFLSKKYNGQLTAININNDIEKLDMKFAQWYKKLVYSQRHKDNIEYCGSKEVMCEEFIPCFLNNNIKSIIIIRDPRDVIASMHFGKGHDFVGEHRPLLFDLKNWRKSFYLALGNIENKNFFFSKYEDLVENPLSNLNQIADFLKVDHFDNDLYHNGINSQDKTIWKGNSSFDLDEVISKKSVGGYKSKLDFATINFIETICHNEMNFLGYVTNVDYDKSEEIILNYDEPFDIKKGIFKNKYEKKGEMRYLEIRRFRGQNISSYIYSENIKKLRIYHE